MPLVVSPRRLPGRPLLAALAGALLGLLAFAGVAALAHLGRTQAAGLLAEITFLATLTALAAMVLLAQPARLRRARVPVNRAVPHAWWPASDDRLPLMAACFGAPLVAGAGAAVLLFR